MLGFRIDPAERLTATERELISLHQLYHSNPTFGVEVNQESEHVSRIQNYIVEVNCKITNQKEHPDG